VLQPLQIAEQIVFLLQRRGRDDSEHTALMLREGMRIPKEKVFVYGGGMQDGPPTTCR